MEEKVQIPVQHKGLRLIGAGFGRTGTLSLKAALEELDLNPCYHMVEVFKRPHDIELWEAASRGEAINWDDIFGEYQAVVDWPACDYYQKLMQAYPDAKVLLTVRDPESWYTSTRNTIYKVSKGMNRSFLSLVARIFLSRMWRAGMMINRTIWNGTFAGKFEDKQYAIGVFEQHIEDVKRTVPPERLLVYSVKEGWEPLCNFLGVEVPKDKPFPHLNETASFAGGRTRFLSVFSNRTPGTH